MVADPGFSGKKLYDLSMTKGFQVVCPVKKYKNTPLQRLTLVDLYESDLDQVVYSRRRTSIEPLIQHIKSVFRIEPVPVRVYYLMTSVTLYCLVRVRSVVTPDAV
jgi:hypothetical protein